MFYGFVQFRLYLLPKLESHCTTEKKKDTIYNTDVTCDVRTNFCNAALTFSLIYFALSRGYVSGYLKVRLHVCTFETQNLIFLLFIK